MDSGNFTARFQSGEKRSTLSGSPAGGGDTQPQGRGWAGAGQAEECWRCSTRNPKSCFGVAVFSEQFRTWLPRCSPHDCPTPSPPNPAPGLLLSGMILLQSQCTVFNISTPLPGCPWDQITHSSLLRRSQKEARYKTLPPGKHSTTGGGGVTVHLCPSMGLEFFPESILPCPF